MTAIQLATTETELAFAETALAVAEPALLARESLSDILRNPGPSGRNLMKRASIILLLLAIVLGMSAGPHPCHGTEGPSRATLEQTAAEHAACHGGKPATEAPPRQDHDCCDPVKGGHALCDQACQGSGVLGFAPALASVRSFIELTAVLQDRPASQFVPSIDHVPLA